MFNEEDYMKQFAGFLQNNWTNAQYSTMTPIQEKMIPSILEGQDVIAESPTGTGKTLAYVLPILQNINQELKNTQAIVLAPTRELAMQIYEEVQRFIKGSTITAASFIGGADIKRQIDKLKKSPQFVVGTPQRIKELVQRKKLKMHQVKTIVMDEIDRLLENEGEAILTELIKTTQKDRQIIFASATLSQPVHAYAQTIMNQPETIHIKQDELPEASVDHMYLVCEQRDKLDMIRRLLRRPNVRALVFVDNNKVLDQLAVKLDHMGLDIDVLYGEAHKTERAHVIQRMKQNKVTALLVSDIAARGLDFKGITHVINYDIPREPSQYVHRAGRTGRMGAAGLVISLVTVAEIDHLKKLTNKLNVRLQAIRLYKGEIVTKK